MLLNCARAVPLRSANAMSAERTDPGLACKQRRRVASASLPRAQLMKQSPIAASWTSPHIRAPGKAALTPLAEFASLHSSTSVYEPRQPVHSTCTRCQRQQNAEVRTAPWKVLRA